MPRIRRTDDRARERREHAEQAAAEALGQSENGPKAEVTVHVFADDKPPRLPAVGLHAGASMAPCRTNSIDSTAGAGRR